MAQDFTIEELKRLLSQKLNEKQKQLKAEIQSMRPKWRISAVPAERCKGARTKRTRVRRRARRKRNGPTLKETMYAALSASRKPLTIAELQQAVLERGYETKSANLRNIVSHAVYADPNVKRAGKGKFRVRKVR